MYWIRTASEAKALHNSRSLQRSPPSFDGTLEQLYEHHILDVLPSPEAVEVFHGQLVEYARRPDALFLLRMVGTTTRGQIYEGRDGIRWKATDNAPAWWVHAALFQDCRIADDSFAAVIATVPTQMFEVP